MERGEFKGTIGRYHGDSEPYWPPEPPGAPNVLVVVLDDVGSTPATWRRSPGSSPTPTTRSGG